VLLLRSHGRGCANASPVGLQWLRKGVAWRRVVDCMPDRQVLCRRVDMLLLLLLLLQVLLVVSREVRVVVLLKLAAKGQPRGAGRM